MTSKQTEFSYRNITLYKSQSLGSGSYGGVCKARCDGLLCAAKIMHPTLFDLHDPGSASYLAKFQEECRLLSLARHPNVVQYLATDCDPDTRLPVLLMELCDESLTAFLERSPGHLSYHIQVNIAHDIALALIYLHSNGLIHRDLTGNNVLMIAGPRAKITDFGMSKLATVNPRMTALTLCPGNILYMSPEALDDAKVYTAKLDIFSFGVIVIQILTRQFPNPTDRFRSVWTASTEDSEDETVDVRQVVPDRERRKQHLQFIPDSHSLKPLALQCLKRRERLRPSAIELCENITELKESPQYGESLEQVQHTNSSIIQRQIETEHRAEMAELQAVICDKDKKLQDCRRLVRSLETRLQGSRQTLEDKNRELWAKETELITLSGVMRRQERELQEMQQKLRGGERMEVLKLTESTSNDTVSKSKPELCETPQKDTLIVVQKNKEDLNVMPVPTSSVEEHRQVEDEPVIIDLPPDHPVRLLEAAGGRRSVRAMTWTRSKSAPEKLRRGATVVHGNKAYFRPANSVKAYCYDNIVGIQHWSQLPENPNTNCGLVFLDHLTTVGGIGYNSPTNVLLSLVDGKKEKEWREIFPHMAIPRYGAACITTEKALVVAGGLAADEGLNTVEVMKTDTKQWSIVCSLPRKCSWMSPAIMGDMLYLAGGFIQDKPSNCVLSCTVSNLLTSSTFGSKILWSLSSSLGAWKEASHVPVTRSTLALFGGNLLAIGGEDDSEKPTAVVYGYDPTTDSWNRVTQMKDRRSWCLAATLPENRLVVVGGFTDRDGDITCSVEVLN